MVLQTSHCSIFVSDIASLGVHYTHSYLGPGKKTFIFISKNGESHSKVLICIHYLNLFYVGQIFLASWKRWWSVHILKEKSNPT